MEQLKDSKTERGFSTRGRRMEPFFKRRLQTRTPLILLLSALTCSALGKDQDAKFQEISFETNDKEVAGKHNQGGKDKPWPEGLQASYKIRFIRLDHGGQAWDDGMRQTRADVNFLRHFAKVTGFNTAQKSESHRIGLLDKYPRDGFPPFVFLTGNDQIGQVSQKDIKILREYCLGGGLLIADAGSQQFHKAFLHLMRQVFPDKPMLDIADDDSLYQIPNKFPDGAPAFWHHGGKRPLGIKHEGRWVVFYHPGDMNDAWKSDGYTDVTPEMKEAALNLGVNLVYYSFVSWDQTVLKARK